MSDPEKILSMQEVLEELKKFKQETLGELTKLEDRIIQSFGPDYCKYCNKAPCERAGMSFPGEEDDEEPCLICHEFGCAGHPSPAHASTAITSCNICGERFCRCAAPASGNQTKFP